MLWPATRVISCMMLWPRVHSAETVATCQPWICVFTNIILVMYRDVSTQGQMDTGHPAASLMYLTSSTVEWQQFSWRIYNIFRYSVIANMRSRAAAICSSKKLQQRRWWKSCKTLQWRINEHLLSHSVLDLVGCYQMQHIHQEVLHLVTQVLWNGKPKKIVTVISFCVWGSRPKRDKKKKGKKETSCRN